MKKTAKEIHDTIIKAKPLLLEISSAKSAEKPDAASWSPREVIGHLIDSACNNHQRFVRAAQKAAGDFPAYHPDSWVAVQHYNEAEWPQLVELFCLYNLHHVLTRLPGAVLQNPCNIGKERPVTLEFVAEDYVSHLRHHLDRVMNR